MINRFTLNEFVKDSVDYIGHIYNISLKNEYDIGISNIKIYCGSRLIYTTGKMNPLPYYKLNVFSTILTSLPIGMIDDNVYLDVINAGKTVTNFECRTYKKEIRKKIKTSLLVDQTEDIIILLLINDNGVGTLNWSPADHHYKVIRRSNLIVAI